MKFQERSIFRSVLAVVKEFRKQPNSGKFDCSKYKHGRTIKKELKNTLLQSLRPFLVCYCGHSHGTPATFALPYFLFPDTSTSPKRLAHISTVKEFYFLILILQQNIIFFCHPRLRKAVNKTLNLHRCLNNNEISFLPSGGKIHAPYNAGWGVPPRVWNPSFTYFSWIT